MTEISSDFLTDSQGNSFYKVKCQMERNYLMLKSGQKGILKKGMTVSAHFMITRRSLFDLLYQKIDDWANPKQYENNAMIAKFLILQFIYKYSMMSKKGIKIKQFDITDCGAACLASVCAYYGLQFPIARIRQYAFTDQKGTNILGLIEAANKLGLSAKGVRAKFEALYIVPKPVIAHVIVHEQLQHFVVIYKVEKKKRIHRVYGSG